MECRAEKLYHRLLDEADEVIYVSEEYTDGCMKKRNRYMVERSDYCICVQIYQMGGTVQMVKYAKKKGLRVIQCDEID